MSEKDMIESLYETKKKLNRATNRIKQVLLCKVCPLKSDRLSNMHDHIRSHLKLKPFKCRHCDRGFSQMFNCQRHESEGSCLRVNYH